MAIAGPAVCRVDVGSSWLWLAIRPESGIEVVACIVGKDWYASREVLDLYDWFGCCVYVGVE